MYVCSMTRLHLEHWSLTRTPCTSSCLFYPTMTSKLDAIDLTTSPTLSASLPVPHTTRNRRPRSATSSSSRYTSPAASEEIIDTSLLPDAGDDHPRAQQVASANARLHGRKRRRVDISGEEQQTRNVHQLDEARSSSHPPDNNVPEDIAEASTSSQVASDPLLSSGRMFPDLMLDSFSFPLDEEYVEFPPLTQESLVSQDAGADISEVSVLTQRGTPFSVPEATDATSDNVVVVSPTFSQRETLPSVTEATDAASDDVFAVSPALPRTGTPSFQETTGAISDDVFVVSPVSSQRGTPSVPEIAHVTSDDVVVISPALPFRRTPSSLRPIVIDDPIPLDMVLASTPKAASHSLPVFPVNDATSSSSSAPEPLSAYTCPICFSPPTNATLTPCGHICCGACLFAAVKSAVKRNMVIAMDRAPVPRSSILLLSFNSYID